MYVSGQTIVVSKLTDVLDLNHLPANKSWHFISRYSNCVLAYSKLALVMLKKKHGKSGHQLTSAFEVTCDVETRYILGFRTTKTE